MKNIHHIILFMLLCCIQVGCNTHTLKLGSKKHIELTHQLIFSVKLDTVKKYHRVIYVDSILRFREDFFPADMLYTKKFNPGVKLSPGFLDTLRSLSLSDYLNNTDMSALDFYSLDYTYDYKSEFLKKPISDISFKLIIPDSLKNYIHYFPENFNLHDGFDFWSFYSPLLPTSQKNIYFIQKYSKAMVGENSNDFIFDEGEDAKSPFYVVGAYHQIDFYEIKKGKILKLEGKEEYDSYYLGTVNLPRKE